MPNKRPSLARLRTCAVAAAAIVFIIIHGFVVFVAVSQPKTARDTSYSLEANIGL